MALYGSKWLRVTEENRERVDNMTDSNKKIRTAYSDSLLNMNLKRAQQDFLHALLEHTPNLFEHHIEGMDKEFRKSLYFLRDLVQAMVQRAEKEAEIDDREKA